MTTIVVLFVLAGAWLGVVLKLAAVIANPTFSEWLLLAAPVFVTPLFLTSPGGDAWVSDARRRAAGISAAAFLLAGAAFGVCFGMLPIAAGVLVATPMFQICAVILGKHSFRRLFGHSPAAIGPISYSMGGRLQDRGYVVAVTFICWAPLFYVSAAT